MPGTTPHVGADIHDRPVGADGRHGPSRGHEGDHSGRKALSSEEQVVLALAFLLGGELRRAALNRPETVW